jgi:hypothetical protein
MKVFKKRRRWRQQGPRDEMIILLNAIRGQLSNVASGILPGKYAEEKTADVLDDIEAISKLLPEKWP